MTLDCTTARGRLYIARQHEIAARCGATWNVTPVATPDTKGAAVDVMFMRATVLASVAEIKARELTRAQLTRFGSYLVTFEKLEQGRRLAQTLSVPFLLIVGLWPDREIVWWPIAKADGTYRFEIRRERTPTQATCNGGQATRENAYLPLDHMRLLDADPQAPPAHAIEVCDQPLTWRDINW